MCSQKQCLSHQNEALVYICPTLRENMGKVKRKGKVEWFVSLFKTNLTLITIGTKGSVHVVFNLKYFGQFWFFLARYWPESGLTSFKRDFSANFWRAGKGSPDKKELLSLAKTCLIAILFVNKKKSARGLFNKDVTNILRLMFILVKPAVFNHLIWKNSWKV